MRTPVVPEFSMPARNRRVLLAKRPTGIPQAADFGIDEVPITRPEPGQILCRNIFLSVDPAQRGWASDVANYSAPVPLNTPMRSLGVAAVVESQNEGFQRGDFVYGWVGWQDYAVLDHSQVLAKVEPDTIPLSAYAGILGINGVTAYLAFNDLTRPQEGEYVLVSTAAGAVGSVVGQLAKDLGCVTIGLTSDPEKVKRCVERFGFDAALNYRELDVAEQIDRVAPKGLDIYFDNVGGELLDMALRKMRVKGRIVQCGTAAIASWLPAPQGPRNEREVLTRRLSWNGFVIFDHLKRFGAAQHALAKMIAKGTLVYDEDVDVGLEQAPKAISELYSGQNSGKKLIYIG